ncbi:hypothetical protein AAK894_02890 [Lachnospiraceae bacterium 46-61]
MKTGLKKRLLSIVSIITLTIINNYPTVKQGAKELDRITFVDSVTGESAFPSFFVSSQRIKKTYNLNTIE